MRQKTRFRNRPWSSQQTITVYYLVINYSSSKEIYKINDFFLNKISSIFYFIFYLFKNQIK